MDALTKSDFQALRAKFQERDVIKNKPNFNLKVSDSRSSQTPDATVISDPKTEPNVTKVDITETIIPLNAISQQSRVKSPCPLPRPKHAFLKLPDQMEPSASMEGGGRPEDLPNSNPASMDGQKLEHKNVVNNQSKIITLKEKINIWENSSHCIVPSTSSQKVKCSTLPPSLGNLRSKPLSETPYKVACLTQAKKEIPRMGPEGQIPGLSNEVLQDSIMNKQSREDFQMAINSQRTAPFSQPEMDLSTSQNDQKGFKRDSIQEPRLQDLSKLGPVNDTGSMLTDDRINQDIVERWHLHKSLHRQKLPPIDVLGPPPAKPPRPFRVDLSTLRNIDMGSWGQLESSEKNNTPSPPRTRPEKDDISSTESDAQETNYENVRHHKETEQEKELQDRKIEEKQLDQIKKCEDKKRKKELHKFNLTGSELPIHKVQIHKHLKGGKLNLKVQPGKTVEIIRMVDCPAGKWLAKSQDGNYGYIHIDAVKMNIDEIKEVNNRLSKCLPMTDEIYDDVGLNDMTEEECSTEQLDSIEETSNIYDDVLSKVMTSPIDSSPQIHLADKESLHEEVYDDVEIGSPDVHSASESTLSTTTNLDSDKNSLYEDVSNVRELNDSEDRSSKSDTSKVSWGEIFRKRGENTMKTGEMKYKGSERLDFSTEDHTVDVKTPRAKVKGIFKVKKKDPSEEKETKVNKKKMLNEQEFRENFNYTKKILVENVAVVERNVVQEQKGSLYLRIKPREKLDVIDIGEDNLIICRNKEGKYGYVHIRHLIFGTS
ncbi:FYN-binding protein 1 isoform X4 [Leucoraja erinacea]|uniref:FYN-binding protein 1 isoform X4 n=1 Tax=Leucoraja erinaceus TaxID=7782 RepID=UPI002454C67D|nr:FYN-binding protein 1 isoform X4 [Leucoraja erinacea]